MYRDVDSVMFFFLHVSILIYGIGATADHGCPPWMYRPLTNSSCQCGSSLNGSINSTSALSVHMCMYLTYNPFTNRSIAGHSSYSCIANLGQPSYQLPMRRENFTSLSCGVWNREGPLCSKCITDHGVPLYTYDLMCIPNQTIVQVSGSFFNSTHSVVRSGNYIPLQCAASSLEWVCTDSSSDVVTFCNAVSIKQCNYTKQHGSKDHGHTRCNIVWSIES